MYYLHLNSKGIPLGLKARVWLCTYFTISMGCEVFLEVVIVREEQTTFQHSKCVQLTSPGPEGDRDCRILNLRYRAKCVLTFVQCFLKNYKLQSFLFAVAISCGRRLLGVAVQGKGKVFFFKKK